MKLIHSETSNRKYQLDLFQKFYCTHSCMYKLAVNFISSSISAKRKIKINQPVFVHCINMKICYQKVNKIIVYQQQNKG